MRRRLIVAAMLLMCSSARAQTRGAVDWIFVIDTSKSMRGIGGTKDIFADVKGSVETFVREAGDGDSVTILTFDRDVASRGLRDIRGAFDRDELFEVVRALEANGNRTHLGAAIAKGLERSEAMMKRSDDATRQRAIVLFTDGKEDVKGIANPVSIPSNIERAQKSRPWIFFVSMGEHETQLDVFTKATERSRVLRAEDPDAIRKAAQAIRTIVQPPPPPPEPLVVNVVPAAIDLGVINAGESSAEHELTISTNKPARVSVALADSEGVTMTPRENIAVAPSAPARIKVQFATTDGAAIGPRTMTIRVGGTAKIAANVTITRPSLALRIAKWLGAILALLVLALIALVLYTGRMPGELLASIAERNALEGEIEIMKPRVASDAAFVGLPSLKTSNVALSTIMPLDALAGSDARLFVQRKSGEKKVCIAAQSGTLRVNDIEVPMSELFDADTIRIGDATLRFNRAGHERPQEDRP
jgi:hypothetical protein